MAVCPVSSKVSAQVYTSKDNEFDWVLSQRAGYSVSGFSQTFDCGSQILISLADES